MNIMDIHDVDFLALFVSNAPAAPAPEAAILLQVAS